MVEEVRYDFEEFPRYADDFIRDLLKLMIISKMNCALKSNSSKEYFMGLIDHIEGCEAYVVKYGQPLLYARYHGMEFTDQKVTSQFMRVNDHVVDVTMESVFGEYVKKFDSLASRSESKVVWGMAKKPQQPDGAEKEVVAPSKDAEKEEGGKKKKSKGSEKEDIENEKAAKRKQEEASRTFALLNLFIDVVGKLTRMDQSAVDSLAGKRFGIRNVSVTGRSLHLEFLIDGGLNMVMLNPMKKNRDESIVLLFNKSEIARAIVSLMKQ